MVAGISIVFAQVIRSLGDSDTINLDARVRTSGFGVIP